MVKPEKFVHLHLAYHFTVPFKGLRKLNPLQSGVAYLYPLKTLENLKVF